MNGAQVLLASRNLQEENMKINVNDIWLIYSQ